MSRQARWEYLQIMYARYRRASRRERPAVLDEVCATCDYHRKYALRLMNGPPPSKQPRRRRPRRPTYGSVVLSVLTALWEAAGYPWSVRLKAMLPLWLPWARKHFHFSEDVEQQLRRISPRTMDLRLRERKRHLRKRLYGHTRPGSLLKHHIPIKTDAWDVTTPGFTEIDLVSHSGERADGEFAYSLNLTDIQTTWVETRAVLGKGETGVCQALEQIRQSLPFSLRGIDSDNGSEFINAHLWRYCQQRQMQFTRGRPYKKNDNAHIEQKNWTHVRKLLGYERYDSPEAVAALNDLYQHERRLLQNLFLPSVKLQRKVRVGSRVRRVYAPPQTPFDRLRQCPGADALQIAALERLRASLDPFQLSATIDRKLESIYARATRTRPSATLFPPNPQPSTGIHRKKKEAKKKEPSAIITSGPG